MKTLIALLAMLTMLLGTGCSKTANDQAGNNTDNSVTDNQDGMTGDRNGTDQNGALNNNDHTIGDDVRDGMDNAGNAIRNGVDDIGDAVTGGNATDRGNAGTTGSGAAVTTNP